VQIFLVGVDSGSINIQPTKDVQGSSFAPNRQDFVHAPDLSTSFFEALRADSTREGTLEVPDTLAAGLAAVLGRALPVRGVPNSPRDLGGLCGREPDIA
jgi:hypothetical protein